MGRIEGAEACPACAMRLVNALCMLGNRSTGRFLPRRGLPLQLWRDVDQRLLEGETEIETQATDVLAPAVAEADPRQSEEPQFLLIEEPENGLNPKIVKELVGFFREKCQEKGHYIWLTSHSPSIVSELTQEELIIVDKINGETKIKQFQNIDLHGMKLDEAWLSNVFDGGLPW